MGPILQLTSASALLKPASKLTASLAAVQVPLACDLSRVIPMLAARGQHAGCISLAVCKAQALDPEEAALQPGSDGEAARQVLTAAAYPTCRTLAPELALLTSENDMPCVSLAVCKAQARLPEGAALQLMGKLRIKCRMEDLKQASKVIMALPPCVLSRLGADKLHAGYAILPCSTRLHALLLLRGVCSSIRGHSGAWCALCSLQVRPRQAVGSS